MPDISSILDGKRSELCRNVDWDTYRAIPAMNPSTVVYGLKSMLALRWAWDHPGEPTDAMLWGSAVHCLLFEPNLFDQRYAAWKGRRAGNDYKDFEAECWSLGKVVLAEKDWDKALDAAKSFVRKPDVKEIIRAGQAESTVFTVEGRVQCRGRLDWISSSTHRLVDLKTTNDITADKFSRTFYAFHYDTKMGLYQRWLNKLTNDRWPVSLIVLESRPPYDIAVMPIDDAVLDRGARRGLEVIRRLPECIEKDCWPGIDAEGYNLATPTWEMDDEEELEGATEVNYANNYANAA